VHTLTRTCDVSCAAIDTQLFTNKLNSTPLCFTQCPPTTFTDVIANTCVLSCSHNPALIVAPIEYLCVYNCTTQTSTELYLDADTHTCVQSCPSNSHRTYDTHVCASNCATTGTHFYSYTNAETGELVCYKWCTDEFTNLLTIESQN
jgi:hypothetical protein